jgi:hypothetical protein
VLSDQLAQALDFVRGGLKNQLVVDLKQHSARQATVTNCTVDSNHGEFDQIGG